MKQLFLYLMIAIGLTRSTGKFQGIPFQTNLPTTSPVYKTLGVKDSNALIVSVFENSHWYKSLTTQYLVFYPNGRITKITLERSKDGNSKSDLSKRKVKSRDCAKYTQWLETCISKNLFELDQALLNTTKKPSETPGKTTHLSISDGVRYNFSVFLNRRTLHYSAYAPRAYIEDDFPGKEDLLKFLKVIESFNEVYND